MIITSKVYSSGFTGVFQKPFGDQSSFSPLAFGAKLWLDATDATTITITGSGISTWADKSGNSNDLTQSTDSKRPTYNTGSNVSFDKSAVQNLSLAAFAGGTLTQPTTWAVTVQHRATGNDEYLFDDSVGTNRQLFFTNAADFSIFSGSTVAALAADDTTLHTYIIEYNDTSTSAFQDGGSNLISSYIGSLGITGIRIGTRFNEVSAGDYDIYGLVVIEDSLSTTDKNLLGNFMANKHGTTWSDIA